jgi:alkanesulfonate monooxygenase SsuD/methylene tetrahydromethanopterin reductase-like flavin-dependent oxidoreductase (luciferase family)
MWTKRRATYEGYYHRVKDAISNPKPIQKPYPTIIVGVQGKSTI